MSRQPAGTTSFSHFQPSARSRSPAGAQSTISERAWLHAAMITALTRKNQYKQEQQALYISSGWTACNRLPHFFLFLFYIFFLSSHTVIACERAPLWRRCRRSATQRSPRRGTRQPMPIFLPLVKTTTRSSHVKRQQQHRRSLIGTVALVIDHTRDRDRPLKEIRCTTRSPPRQRRPPHVSNTTATKIHKRVTIARRRGLAQRRDDDD